jgi:hypothetical protein
MKTTVDISKPLLDQARRAAAREGTTLRALIERGLRQVLDGNRRPGDFRLRDASFLGNGLQPDVRGASWERLRELAYEGRGA